MVSKHYRDSLPEHFVSNSHHHHRFIGRLLLKVDIEGMEWEALLVFNVGRDALSMFSQILVEFHTVGHVRSDVSMELRRGMLAGLLEQFVIVHVHRNNFAEYSSNLEVTFANRRIFESANDYCRLPRLHPLDAPTLPKQPELDPAKTYKPLL